jgi:hypothetical protein
MIRPALTIAALILALSACGDPSPADDILAAPVAQPANEPVGPASPAAPPAGPFAATPAPGEELPPSQSTPGPIPLAYRHLWAIDPIDCTRQPGFTRIAIAPGAIRFYEGRAVVTKAQVEGPDKLLLDVSHTSEGETRPQRHSLALSNAGSRLLYQRGRESLRYIRCD